MDYMFRNVSKYFNNISQSNLLSNRAFSDDFEWMHKKHNSLFIICIRNAPLPVNVFLSINRSSVVNINWKWLNKTCFYFITYFHSYFTTATIPHGSITIFAYIPGAISMTQHIYYRYLHDFSGKTLLWFINFYEANPERSDDNS